MILTPRSPSPTSPTALAQLSRNASVISSSSSSSSSSSITGPTTPTRERPPRAFSPPRRGHGSRDREPLEAAAATAAVQPRPHITLPAGGLKHADNGPPTPRARGPPLHGRQAVTRADFAFGDTLGEGSYSEVVSATHKATGKAYAIKVISKMHLIKKDKVKYATSERDALAILTAGDHPGIIHLYWTFQDQASLYFALSMAPNGELQSLVRKLGSLSLRCARYYTAQIVDAVTWMHDRGVIHRDVKPENILLDSDWRIKLTDFGSAKVLRRGQDGAFVEDRETTRSFVGSPQYVSPELLLDQYKYACKSSDLYAIGCILFQLLTGQFLFHALTEFLTFQKIKKGEHTPFPDWLDSRARDLIERLLPLDPAERLGAAPKSGPEELKAHPFFTDAHPADGLAPVDWAALWRVEAPGIEPGMVKREPGPEPEDDAANNGWDEFDGGFVTAPDPDPEREHEDALVNGVQKLELQRPREEPEKEDPRGRERGSVQPRAPQRSGSQSQSSDGTTSSLDHSHSHDTSIPLQQITRMLAPGERVSYIARVHFRREILGGIVRKDRAGALCLTASPARLILLRAPRGAWRTEAVLQFAGDTAGVGEGVAGGTILGVEAAQGERLFTVRTASRNHLILAPDEPAAERWVALLRDAMRASTSIHNTPASP
ncbi:kinase-like protein [Auricularia subglabra TFB-10046 SS5]|nr:kinase-like protein [Auricularia subglabra TFB-10046 SS5]